MNKPFLPEALIELELGAMWQAKDRGDQEDAQGHWERAKELIALRTPEQIARMERAKGLV